MISLLRSETIGGKLCTRFMPPRLPAMSLVGLSLTMRTLRRLVRKINHPNVAGYAHADCFPFRR